MKNCKRHSWCLNLAYATIFSVSLFSQTACTEEIDESNFAIKNELTAADYISSEKDLSSIEALFKRVRLGNTDGASSLYNVLTTRGNYTLFLPNNEAVQKYLDDNGLTSIDELSQEQLELITKNCIIDNGSNPAIETAMLPIKGAINIPNLNNRLLSCLLDDESAYHINGKSTIIKEDLEVSNGFIHIVESVIAPSSLTLDRQIKAASNLKVFHYLMEKTTWADSLYKNLDLSYENPDRVLRSKHGQFMYNAAEHRYLGYTAFVEPDSVYEAQLGVTMKLDEEGNLANGEEFVAKLTSKAQACYGNEAPADYSHPDNAINRYVAYHLVDGKMSYNKLVWHYNEYGYKYGDYMNPQTVNMPTNVWEYYTTKGKHRGLLQITQVGDTGFEQDKEHKIFINRLSTYANGPEDDYRETGVVNGRYGILIDAENGANDNNSLNGYYFTINNLLFYDHEFRNELYKTRLRTDVATMLPELVTNNFRGNSRTNFDNDFFDNIFNVSPTTDIVYSMVLSKEPWGDLWGDQFRVLKLFDFTLRLPPVPKDGTYEIRMGNVHGYIRGMTQIYFGDDPDRLLPAGLPYDMRITPSPENPSIPWQLDTDDWTANFENDKFLRNQGYMKGPKYFTECNGRADSPVRLRGGTWGCIRRVIATAHMEADKTYYIRFKSALKKFDAEIGMDFFELASSHVYNGAIQEDIW